MKRSNHILLNLLLVAIPVLMALADASAQTEVYAGQTTDLGVVETPGDTYTWELYNDITGTNFAVDPGNCPATEAFFAGGINTGPTVQVTWLTPGNYFFKVTAIRSGCSDNLRVGMVTVLEALPVATIQIQPPICQGDTAALTIDLTGTAPWSLDISDGTDTLTYTNISATPFILYIAPALSTSYTVTRVSDVYGVNTVPSNTVTLIVKPRPVTTPIIQYGP